MNWSLLATLLALGLGGGFLSGLLGLGGAIFMIPLLLYVPPLLGVGLLDHEGGRGGQHGAGALGLPDRRAGAQQEPLRQQAAPDRHGRHERRRQSRRLALFEEHEEFSAARDLRDAWRSSPRS